MDIPKIAHCLFSKWNHTISHQKAQKEIQQLLSRRKPLRLYHDLQRRLQNGGDKKVPSDTFLITCALFCRAQDNKQEISSAIHKYGMEQMLFEGFRIFLHNKKTGYKFTISWGDRHFPNNHTWLSRFAGEFRDFGYQELLSVATLLYRFDEDKLWQIAKEDPNDLILLNWYEIFPKFPSSSRILELFMQGESTRRHALAFWWMTYSIHSLSEGEAQACDILSKLENVPAHILVPCVYEFILTHFFFPGAFRDYLLTPSHDALLRKEFMRVDLVAEWRQALVLSTLIQEIPSLRQQNFYWRTLLTCIVEKVKVGQLIYSTKSERDFLSSLPARHLKQLQATLSTWSSTLHVQTIDSIVRPEIFYHDRSVNTAIQYILACPIDTENRPVIDL